MQIAWISNTQIGQAQKASITLKEYIGLESL